MALGITSLSFSIRPLKVPYSSGPICGGLSEDDRFGTPIMGFTWVRASDTPTYGDIRDLIAIYHSDHL